MQIVEIITYNLTSQHCFQVQERFVLITPSTSQWVFAFDANDSSDIKIIIIIVGILKCHKSRTLMSLLRSIVRSYNSSVALFLRTLFHVNLWTHIKRLLYHSTTALRLRRLYISNRC